MEKVTAFKHDSYTETFYLDLNRMLLLLKSNNGAMRSLRQAVRFNGTAGDMRYKLRNTCDIVDIVG